MKYKSFLTIAFLLCTTTSIAQQKNKHTVQKGETIESIAKKYNITVANLQEANPDIDILFYVGLKLDIPQNRQSATSVEHSDTQVVKNDLHDNKTGPTAIIAKQEESTKKLNVKTNNNSNSII